MTEKPKPLQADDATSEEADRQGGDNAAECFEDDEFICPACCCGIYIEVKE
ncbi:hypothetical protein [Pelotomaculum propionicicum]|uniref:Uncharacterized protein n=1 Tax=Pelotomaculum propionicicum TaxID=258475 RepID=A0A4Y7RTG9_9FIRM|nr:hypothetical protein [Pelotomaculum propionicicum]NLI13557.1 hypothetical protein [Peptococcaceae bacterium]TEB11982.1 hypothetical protein Pmgp_01349 [Pelotomaculum propionicicum]